MPSPDAHDVRSLHGVSWLNRAMPVVHHFAHGPTNPIAAYALAFLGALLGLSCTARARTATTRIRRARWLGTASFSIGGGIWLMHFTAMLGFDIPDSPVRYDPVITAASAVMAVAVVGAGLFIAGTGRRAVWKVLLGGVLTGTGVAAMHYTGMAAMRIDGHVGYDRSVVGASVLIAIVAATVALWLSVTVQGRGPILFSAGIMGVAVCGMHYTAMGAMRVHLFTDAAAPVAGMEPITLILPITVITMATLVGLVFSALQTATLEEFGRSPAPTSHAVHRQQFAVFSGSAPVPPSARFANHQ